MPRTPPPGWTLPPPFNLQNAPYTPGYQAPASPASSVPPSYAPPANFNAGNYSNYNAPAPQAPAPQEMDWQAIYDQMSQYFEPFVPQPGFYEGWNPQNLTPNFFSPGTGPWVGMDGGNVGDRPPDYPYGLASGPAAPGATAAPAVPSRPRPPTNLPLPSTSPFLEFSDQTLGYAPSQAQGYMPNFLQGLGFQGVGNVGQYGERTYKRESADPFAFNESNFTSIADPTIRGWLRYFLGGGQLPTG